MNPVRAIYSPGSGKIAGGGRRSIPGRGRGPVLVRYAKGRREARGTCSRDAERSAPPALRVAATRGETFSGINRTAAHRRGETVGHGGWRREATPPDRGSCALKDGTTMLKKLLALFVAVGLLAGVTGCPSDTGKTKDKDKKTTTKTEKKTETKKEDGTEHKKEEMKKEEKKEENGKKEEKKEEKKTEEKKDEKKDKDKK
jgi:C4-dicarboxylate-specific signal transduction histidine kinase